MYGFSEMMMEEAEKQFSQEGREKKTMTSKEKLAIGEAIHAMMWLDKHCKGWGLEEEVAILQNMCSNQEEKEIQSNHNYLDLQYQLDDAIKDVNMRQAAKIQELETDMKQSERVIEAKLDVIDQQAARIKELEAQLTITNVALENATRKPNVVYITGTGEIGADATKTIDQTPNSAENMQKTGPDSPKMAVWQITKGRGRAMTLTEEQRGTVAFDLERAREICEAATKADFIFQDEQPDGDEDGWDGGYYKTGEILIIRDKNDDAAAPESIGQLDRQGDAEFFCQAITLFPDALAEIERLRAENLELQVAVFGPDGIRANQACIIADQAARIKELEAQINNWNRNC